MYETYRTETVKHYFCGRCGNELKPNKPRVSMGIESLVLFVENIEHNKEKGYISKLQSPMPSIYSRENRLFLCPRCMKELNRFLRNEYPTEQSEREKQLEEEIRKIKENYSYGMKTARDYTAVLAKFMSKLDAEIIEEIDFSPEQQRENYITDLEAFKVISETNEESEVTHDNN